jgi:hypothetical protein
MRLLDPVEMSSGAGYQVRAYDDASDMYCCECVPRSTWRLGGREYAEHHAMLMLRAVAWAMRKYDIPPSWQTAYYRVAGKWPEGMQI